MDEEINKEMLRGAFAPPPSPIEKRECKCGCGHAFQPKRRDQVYLNSQHSNYGYNHGIRKRKNKVINQKNKQLLLNDRILEKHHKSLKGDPVTTFLNTVKADGFDSSFYVQTKPTESSTYYYIYKYAFSIIQQNNQTLIQIYKL